MKWLFLIFKLRELRRLHKYNEDRYWIWLKTMQKYDDGSSQEIQCYNMASYHEKKMRELESQIKLLT